MDWIEKADIIRLDTAVCNKTLRPLYLEVLRTTGFSFDSITIKNGDNELAWIRQRGVYVEKIVLIDISAFDQLPKDCMPSSYNRGVAIEFPPAAKKSLSFIRAIRIFKRFGALVSLTLQQPLNVFTDAEFCAILASCSQLKELEIANCVHLTNRGIAEISELCTKLQRVSFIQCKEIHPSSLYFLLKNLPDLQYARFESCYGREIVKEMVEGCVTHQLSVLELVYVWYVSDVMTKVIISCLPNLSTIILRGTMITVDVVKMIRGTLPRLTTLDVSASTYVTDDHILQFVGNETGTASVSYLQTLSLSYCSRISDVALMEISKTLPFLESLSLQNCLGISDHGVGYLTKLNKLRFLDLRQCYSLSNTSFLAIILDLSTKELKALHIADCKRLSDAVFLDAIHQYSHVLLELPSRLEILDIEGCHGITDAGLVHFGTVFPRLLDLNLSRCGGISYSGLAEMLSKTPQLTALCLKRTIRAVSSISIEAIGTHLKQLQTLDISFCFPSLLTVDRDLAWIINQNRRLRLLHLDGTFTADCFRHHRALWRSLRSIISLNGINVTIGKTTSPISQKVSLTLPWFRHQHSR